jgi:Brp/Blh family beta-carotene 15,15'-monooxygenase
VSVADDTPSESAAESARRSLVRATVVPSWAALGVGLLAGVLGPLSSLPLRLRLAPLAASALVLGLPHGAVDHLALPRANGRRADASAFVRIGALYALLGGAYAVLWFVSPVLAAGLFVVLTWAHWGQGDLYPLVALLGADHLRSRRRRALAVAVRGGVPMVVPLLAYPGWYRRVVAAMAGTFGAASVPTWPFAPATRLALGVGFGGLTLLALVSGYRQGGPSRGWLLDAGETALLWAYFWAVPPLLAIGLYFCCWHSLRHVGRLAALDPVGSEALAAGRPGRALRRVGRDAAPLTAVALALLAGGYVALTPGAAPLAALGLYLAFVAVLTLPHTVVVCALDRAQGLWDADAGAGTDGERTHA